MAKLFDKKNIWWYDCVYLLARYNKWLDKYKLANLSGSVIHYLITRLNELLVKVT